MCLFYGDFSLHTFLKKEQNIFSALNWSQKRYLAFHNVGIMIFYFKVFSAPMYNQCFFLFCGTAGSSHGKTEDESSYSQLDSLVCYSDSELEGCNQKGIR